MAVEEPLAVVGIEPLKLLRPKGLLVKFRRRLSAADGEMRDETAQRRVCLFGHRVLQCRWLGLPTIKQPLSPKLYEADTPRLWPVDYLQNDIAAAQDVICHGPTRP